MPKADATELAPKKSAVETLRHYFQYVPEGFCFLPRAVQRVLNHPHFFGEAPERRPWAIKREDCPAALAGRSKCIFGRP